jgi:K+-transporting ATPase ATPase C chain
MKSLITAIKVFLVFTVLTGIVYPLFITGFAQLFFSNKANGSLITKNNQIIGSKLIGQQFDSRLYFMSRPSAVAYNPLPSGGSNYGLTNTKLKNIVNERKRQFLTFNDLDSLAGIPSEMLFASASGLDPHISPKAAFIQVERIAKARNFNESQQKKLNQLIKHQTESPKFLCFGMERVNILLLNLEIDNIK